MLKKSFYRAPCRDRLTYYQNAILGGPRLPRLPRLTYCIGIDIIYRFGELNTHNFLWEITRPKNLKIARFFIFRTTYAKTPRSNDTDLGGVLLYRRDLKDRRSFAVLAHTRIANNENFLHILATTTELAHKELRILIIKERKIFKWMP